MHVTEIPPQISPGMILNSNILEAMKALESMKFAVSFINLILTPMTIILNIIL